MLGKLLVRFGADVTAGKEVDVESTLKNKEVEFQTKNEETESGTFARVLRDTLKPK
jgi:hypothetical protein